MFGLNIIARKNEIRRARPKLRLASPLTFWICLGYVGLNLILAVFIYSQPDTGQLALYFSVFTPHFWGSLFAIQAVILAVALFFNSFKYTRFSLGMGLFIKSFYAYSLIELGLRIGFYNVIAVTSIWLFITYVQFMTIVYFTVPVLHLKEAGIHG